MSRAKDPVIIDLLLRMRQANIQNPEYEKIKALLENGLRSAIPASALNATAKNIGDEMKITIESESGKCSISSLAYGTFFFRENNSGQEILCLRILGGYVALKTEPGNNRIVTSTVVPGVTEDQVRPLHHGKITFEF